MSKLAMTPKNTKITLKKAFTNYKKNLTCTTKVACTEDLFEYTPIQES